MRLDVTVWEGVNKALRIVGGGRPHCKRWEPASLGSCEWHVSGAYAGHDRPSSVQARSKHRRQTWAPTVGETAASNSSGRCVQGSTLTLARIPCSPSPFWIIWLRFSQGKNKLLQPAWTFSPLESWFLIRSESIDFLVILVFREGMVWFPSSSVLPACQLYFSLQIEIKHMGTLSLYISPCACWLMPGYLVRRAPWRVPTKSGLWLGAQQARWVGNSARLWMLLPGSLGENWEVFSEESLWIRAHEPS